VLSLFTRYLLQYKKVCIPTIGTFEIVQLAPVLNFTDKLFLPPSYTTNFLKKDQLSEHQVNYFASCNQFEKDTLRQELISFGEKFRNIIKKGPYQWNGFGTLQIDSDNVVFHPVMISLDSFQNIHAKKVMRGTSDHNMIMGDREITVQEATMVLSTPKTRKPVYMIIGWILLAIAILIIFYILFTGHFEPNSSGLKI